MRTSTRTALAVLINFPSFLFAAHPLDTWHPRDPVPQGERLFRAAHGNGLTLLVGGGTTNMLMISTNGTNWDIGPSTGTRGLKDIVYGEGRFVAVGTDSIATSTDGTNWTAQSPYGEFESIAFGNGVFVTSAIGGVKFSTNGLLWGLTPGPIASPIVFAQGKFVALQAPDVLTSSDGRTWSSHYSGFASGAALAYGPGYFLLANMSGRFYRSPDATTWSDVGASTPPGARSLAYGNGAWVAVGDSGMLWYSTNGSNFTFRILGSNTLYGVSFVDGRFVAAGSLGQIYTSTDGVEWVACSRAVSRLPLYRVTWLNDAFYAAGDRGKIFRSADGADWQSCVTFGTPVLQALAYGNGLYLAAGKAEILASVDGTNWGYTGQGFPVNGLAWGNGRFVAAGPQNRVVTSVDGTNWWGTLPTLTGEWLDAIYAGGRFVLGGASGQIAVSTNGTDWLTQTMSPHGLISRMTFANGVYAAVDVPYGLLISPDGTNWTFRTPPTTTWVTDIAGGAGWWVTYDPHHQLLFSSDLDTWSSFSLRTSSALNSLAFGDHTFVLVGDTGIWQSDPLLLLEIGRQMPLTITVSGPRQRECDLQRCTNLASGSWEPAASLSLTNGPVSWIESLPNAHATYRVLLTR